VDPIRSASPDLAKRLEDDGIFVSAAAIAFFSGERLASFSPGFLERKAVPHSPSTCFSPALVEAGVAECNANSFSLPDGPAPYCRLSLDRGMLNGGKCDLNHGAANQRPAQ
jgi:hypothetical protein